MASFSRCATAALTSAALCAAAAPTASAAPTVSGTKLAASLKKRLTETQGVAAKKVTCPRTIVVRKGNTFTCQSSFTNGDRSALKVTLTNGSGGYKLRLISLLMRKLESEVESKLSEAGVTATVTCPEARKIKKGDKFTCKAKSPEGQTGTVDMTQAGNGLVNFKLRQS